MEVAQNQIGEVFGHARAKDAFLGAVAADKVHHGWMLRGPRGVGKARLALQFALHLLGGNNPRLDMNADTAIGRLAAAGSHPDLRIIRRPVDEKGKQKAEIPVDSIRELAGFFAMRPAMGGWRIAIIDALDELNRFGANAVLKTLEEPPARAVLFLISHGEQFLLPTIISRCRIVRCDALDQKDTKSALLASGLSGERADTVSKLAPGRPGRAVALDGSDAGAVADAVQAVLRTLGTPDPRAFQNALSQAGKSDASLAAAMDTLRTTLEKRAARELDPVAAGDWAAAALDVMRLEGEGHSLNQDRAQTFATALARVARLMRSGS